jgi:glycosyltransferase involved in cell wall biosynthesis
MSERVAVCISTFHRPDGLEAVLRSLGGLTFAGRAPELTIVVVNNDPEDGDPADVCARVRAGCPHDIVLLAEPKRGLSPPRNRAMTHAIETHDFIAYIDDDSTATPTWLAALLDVQRAHDADGVSGPVEPRFDAHPPAWILHGGFFARADRPT